MDLVYKTNFLKPVFVVSWQVVTFLRFSQNKNSWPINHKSCQLPLQWRIQDFPEGGAPTLGGAPTYYLPNFSRKLHENEEILAERQGRASLAPPLDPPLPCVYRLTNIGQTRVFKASIQLESDELWLEIKLVAYHVSTTYTHLQDD